MPYSAWRPTRLTRAQQEERRLAALPLLNDPAWSTRDLAQHFGVAEVTVRAWRARIRHGGEEALRASRATGRPEFLTPEQQQEIQNILESDPRLHGFETGGWTVPKVRQMIGLNYDIWLDRAHLSRKLRRWGFSYQRPALRAVERNEEDIAAWVRLHQEALEKKEG